MSDRRRARAGLRFELRASDVPAHLRFLDMGRYRDVVEGTLRARPGDVFAAGLAAFRMWCGERHAYERHNDLAGPGRDALRKELLGPVTGPDFVWVSREFGVPWDPSRKRYE